MLVAVVTDLIPQNAAISTDGVALAGLAQAAPPLFDVAGLIAAVSRHEIPVVTGFIALDHAITARGVHRKVVAAPAP